MKKYIPIILTMLATGCSKDPLSQPADRAQPTDLSRDQVTKLATDFKTGWMKQNPGESQLSGESKVAEIKPTGTGWLIVFVWVTLPGEPEGESHHFLHVYIDSKGRLEKIVRGPDEIT